MTDLAPPQPYERGTRVELDEVPLAVVRRDGVTLDDIRDLFDEGYAALGTLLSDGTLMMTWRGASTISINRSSGSATVM